MKKLFFGLICLLLCSNAFSAELSVKDKVKKAKDYWVYVNLKDKSGVTADDDKGRSKTEAY
jgi:uncharacterized lipoprotein